MFSRFFNTLAFSAAVDVAVKALRTMSDGPCPFDPAVLAHEAVGELWRVHPGILSGALERRPAPEVVAALALGLILERHHGEPDLQRPMILAMGSVLYAVTDKAERGLMRPGEMMFTLAAQEIYFRVTDAREAWRDAASRSLDGIVTEQLAGTTAAGPNDIERRIADLDRKLAGC